MSSTVQISMNKARERQWNKVLSTRSDLGKMGSTDAATKLLFDAMDSIVPLPKEGEE
ncbi:MAG: hypothetical protein WC406_08255 [Methanoregula sp.]|jgi:hypothetical protein